MDDLVTCPYNVAHSIKKGRLQYHLFKCRQSYPGEFKVCPYNATHHVRDQEMLIHLDSCVDKAVVEARKVEELMNKCRGGFRNLPRPTTPPELELDEDWGLEATGQLSYDPRAACENKKVVLQPPAVPPAQRKAFRQAEKERLENLQGGQMPGGIPGLNYKGVQKKAAIPGLHYKD